MAGYRELLAVERDKHAVECFENNLPGVPVYHGDVEQLGVGEALKLAGIVAGMLTVLDGSPPCQGFSLVGRRNAADLRNQLFLEFARLLQGLQPYAFVMENVPGMVQGRTQQHFIDCICVLKSCGYRVMAQPLNAMHYGVPQDRERLIFVGIREDLGIDPSHPNTRCDPVSLRDALVDITPEIVAARNPDFNNKWRTADLPCCTVTKNPPRMLLESGVDRFATAEECARIGAFPSGYKWHGNWRGEIVKRISNSVPPLFMRAIALHIRKLLAEQLDGV